MNISAGGVDLNGFFWAVGFGFSIMFFTMGLISGGWMLILGIKHWITAVKTEIRSDIQNEDPSRIPSRWIETTTETTSAGKLAR